MLIEVLGPGCKKCQQQYEIVQQALKQVEGAGITLAKVEDVMIIASYGVMSTPAITIDHKVKSVGKVLNVAQVVDLIQSVR